MTLRIDRTPGRRRTRILLSGELRSEHLDQLKTEIEASGRPVALDLEEVDLVDVDCIRFLNAREAEGVAALNCAPYIREWMFQERGGQKKPADLKSAGTRSQKDKPNFEGNGK